MSDRQNDTVTLQHEQRPMTYRNEQFMVLFHFYYDHETEESYTTTALDELNLAQLHNQYRFKNGIPFIDEIKNIRRQFGLSASKMSEILGLATNVYKNYENGEMPSPATGRLIQMIKDPREFKKLIEYSRHKLEESEVEKILRKVDAQLNSWSCEDHIVEHHMFGEINPNIFNGYRRPDIEKIGNMVQYFSSCLLPFTTKMNKLLFYSDFLHFKRKGFSISGLCYKAINLGPVPLNYGALYDRLNEGGFIERETIVFDNQAEGEKFRANNAELNRELFEESEIKVLDEVVKRMGQLSTNAIIDISHDEDAWQQNVDEKRRVNYLYSFFLKNIE